MIQESRIGTTELSQLRQLLVEHYSEGELRTLCFDLGVDYESLPPGGKADKARELLTDLERHGRVPALLEIGQRLRSDVDWAQVYLDDRMVDYRTRRDQADQARRQLRARQRVVNLRPLDMTHTFKDRVRETGELCTHLTQENVRLISIVGRGGMGKTALVSRVLADLERGVLPVPGQDKELAIDGLLYLSALSTGLSLERIYSDVGRMLGEPAAGRLAARWASGEIPLVAKIEYLLEAMQAGLYVVLLDNLENYLTPDGTIADEGLRLFVERCLTQPGGARLIATSREHVQVIPAALRNARSIPLREGLPEDEAVALLRELDPQGELGLRDALEDDLRRAAQLTGGVPRALEIVAGILQADPTASLARLVNDADIFSGQVVENLVAASHQRLGENERRVMEALAVFDCPMEETAIVYLLHPWYPGLDVRGSLRRLVCGYFVSVNRGTSEYSLHPIDREYAYRHLPDDGDPDAYSRRNLELCVADFYASIRKPESEWKTIDDLAPQLAEFEHRVRAGDYDAACLVLDLVDYSYLYLWGHYTRLIELRQKLPGDLMDSRLYASNLGNLGCAYHQMGKFKQAIKSYVKALYVSRRVGDHRNECSWLGRLGVTYRALNQVERAIRLYQRALAIAKDMELRWNEGFWLGNLGIAHWDLGQLEQAAQFCDQALAIARELGDSWQESDWLGQLGNIYRALGKVERAKNVYEQALDISKRIGSRRGESNRGGNLGLIQLDLGNWDKAIELHKEALAIAREIGNCLGESYQLVWMSRPLLFTGRLAEAQGCCVEALVLNMPETGPQAALALGMVLLHQSDRAARDTFLDTAERCRAILDKTLGLYRPRYVLATAMVGQAVCDLCWANASQRAELLAPAIEEYRQALAITSAAGVVGDALRDLELIRKAGIEGLEPIFDLLQGALPKASA